MKILKEYASAELEIKKSKFIAEAFVVTTQADARNLLKEQKKKYFDATHVVHAFIVGLNAEVMGCSDDGEPSGTAGRPMLDVLKGSGITNIMVTVTRYFGGTLLGTGGLVKAYGDSTKEVLAVCAAEEYVSKKEISFDCSYQHYEILKIFLKDFCAEQITEDFAENVSIKATLKESYCQDFASKVFDSTSGKVTVIIK